MTTVDLLGGVVVVAALVATAYDRLTGDPPEDYTVEAARRKYLDGEIPHTEFERRLDVALDDRAQEIRTVVDAVGGIGPELSAAVASEFDSLADLRQATREELADVNGVGPSRADAIYEYLHDDAGECETA